jgi:YidC/Oxa1 family membrane protein insertase
LPITQIWDDYVVSALMLAIAWLSQFFASIGLDGSLLSSWALSIIALTILIKLITLPLTLKQLRSSKAMTAVQPKLQALQKQHKNDREKLMQEQMKLYKEHNVNPVAGCLPMLVQMPVWIALYSALYNLAHMELGTWLDEGRFKLFHDLTPVTVTAGRALLEGSHFLWINNLGLPEPYHLGWPPIIPILPIVVGVTQWIVQKMMTLPTTDPQQKQMQSMMQFMPLMFVVFTVQVPAGLAVYWLTSNIFSAIQQYFITGWGSLLPATAAANLGTSDGKKSQSASAETAAAVASPKEPNGHADGSAAVRRSVMQDPPPGRKRRRRSAR